jgi:NitT/TauT family transport system substrate-binding protein
VLAGIRIKIVADKASSAPGYGATKILVRKDLVDSGRYKTPKDFKGMKFAMNAPGVSNTATLNALLKSVGLRYSDVETVNLPFPDHVVALQNKAVDASASVEPGPTIAIRNGFAVLAKADDEIVPDHQIAVLLYSEAFAKKTDAARRFMRAYIHAVRFYNGALRNGRMTGPNANEVISILAESTPVKDPVIYKAITPTGMNPDGRVNVQSLADDLAFYKEQGLITGDVKIDALVDHSFVDAVVKELGPYRK